MCFSAGASFTAGVLLTFVGAETLRCLVRVGAAALCFESGRVAFFDRDESLALAEANRIAVLARPA